MIDRTDCTDELLADVDFAAAAVVVCANYRL